MYILDNNFIIDILTNRNNFQDRFLDILYYLLKEQKGYLAASQIDNLRYVIKKNYPDIFEKYKKLERNLKIVKTPSYIDFDNVLADIDFEDYIIELSARSIGAKVITSDKEFLAISDVAISPERFYELEMTNEINIDFANLKKQHHLYQSEIEEEIDKVLNSAKFIMGPQIQELEERICEFTGAKYAVTCSSGTDALLLSMMAIDIKPGDEVITTPFTFIATAETIALLGAKPVFVDIDETTYNIDVDKIEEKITDKTKAIIAVSLYGQPCDLDKLNQLKIKNSKLKIIVDGAQSFGATYKGKSEVHYCDIYTTSFFPAKPLGCYGDGGAVLSNNAEYAEKIKMLRIHGQNKRYNHRYIGLGARLDTLQAAILLVKLKHYEKDLLLRQEVAKKYTHQFKIQNSKFKIPVIKNDRTSAWAQYSIRIKERDKMQMKLKEAGIPTAIHYPKALHLQECFNYLGYKEGDFPIAEKISKEIMSLPMNSYLTQEEIEYICKTISELL
jgi:UDP-2-acetamido-2-deoxy-ribo-hexuluronate aminotransferase